MHNVIYGTAAFQQVGYQFHRDASTSHRGLARQYLRVADDAILIECRRDLLFIGPSASLRTGLTCSLCFLALSRDAPINRSLIWT